MLSSLHCVLLTFHGLGAVVRLCIVIVADLSGFDDVM